MRVVARLRGLPPVVMDATLVAVLVSAGLAQQFGRPGVEHQSTAHLIGHVAVIVAAVLPLLLWRRFPFIAVIIITTVLGTSGSVGPFLFLDPSPSAYFALMFATFHAVASCRPLVGRVALALALLAVTLVLRPWITPLAVWLTSYPLPIVAFIAGRAQQQRRELAVLLQDRIVESEAQRGRAHALALKRARTGLARDLHDVVAFALQRMRLSAEDALRRLCPPSRAAEPALAETEAVGRAALSDMRRLLELLRADDAGEAHQQHLRRREEEQRTAAVGRALDDSVLDDSVLARLPRLAAGLRRLGRLGWPADLLLVATLSVAATLEFRFWSGLLGASLPPVTFSTPAYLWALGWIALLLFRRPAPVVTGVAMAAMAFLQTYPFRYWTPTADITALQIALYTIGSRRSRGPYLWLVAVLAAVGIVSIPPPPLTISLVGFFVIVAVTFMAFAYVGIVVGERRRLIAQLDDTLLDMAEARRTELALALHEERVALAREMHDLVAHSVSLMVVQAGAARTVAAADPEAARQAVTIVLGAGHRATDELEQLLTLLRSGTSERLEGSAHRDVEGMVDEARRSGLDIDLERVGSHPPTPGGTVEVFAYRIVQEALTNARKHAPEAHVRVQLRHDPDFVVVRVENDATMAPSSDVAALGAGQGLVGMRERVALLGGRFEAGPARTGGFAVEAVLPHELVST